MPHNKRIISLQLPVELLARIDAAAKLQCISRSDVMRQAVIRQLEAGASAPKFRVF